MLNTGSLFLLLDFLVLAVEPFDQVVELVFDLVVLVSSSFVKVGLSLHIEKQLRFLGGVEFHTGFLLFTDGNKATSAKIQVFTEVVDLVGK